MYNMYIYIYIFFFCLVYFCKGLGGGYNERENVEYIEREESDDEFDDVSEWAGFLKCVASS